MSNVKKMYRQGDVLIVAVASIPVAQEIKRSKRGIVLAEGEVTGHAHRIPSRHAKLYRTETDARYMRVTAPMATEARSIKANRPKNAAVDELAGVALQHEEHSTVVIPPGSYRVTIHREYVPGELPRRVED